MGRRAKSEPPVPVEVIKQTFGLRQNGEIIRRQCHIAALVDEPATFIGPSGKAMTRLGHEGKIRRVLATRIAWTLTHNEQPNGTVRAKNGDDRDLRPDNLVLIKHCAHQPQAGGGRASSLERRQAATGALINALAQHANPTLKELCAAVGLSECRCPPNSPSWLRSV
jgi:hypothetical protein